MADMKWTVETSRWSSRLEVETFDTRALAVQAVKNELAGMFGGWSTCPPSHYDGCKWRTLTANEWESLGFDPNATDRWVHSTTRTDAWHKERIYVRPIEKNVAI